ncbi:FAD-linked oxidase [Parafrankia soli]|uniref:FAD-linked oxidase n=1 Tax=Parafrankia soli TaxID=2599596 RepID=A0A1S1PYL4_9ACTN|nr:FAD-linked oxidase C-terminal domain-containing protein [Parafrankia soli]OHV26409.1 FAD-linked oxidase [Parafrankia soli]
MTSSLAASPPALAPLIADLPPDSVIVDPDRMAGYRWDRANDPNAGMPLAVVRVTSTSDVRAVLRFASEHRIPAVPRGAGTGLSGGSSAVDGCIVVSTERMREIDVDPTTRTVRVQPGALNAEVKAAAAAHGLWYPPDPSSFEICSIGGDLATNAGGLCCVKYGVTTDYVLALTVVLADGTVVQLGGPPLKDVAGLSLTKLFVGSEGTLGIITEAVLRLIPAQRPPATVVATFGSLDHATATVLDITRRMRPSMLELMDRASINAVEDVTSMGLDREAEAMLLIQSDEPGATAAAEVAEIEALCGIADIADQRQVEIAVIAHAGDGNTHPLIITDRTDPEQTARAETAYGEVMDLAIALGGTITGEHGVGRLKKPWLPGYLGPDVLRLNQRIKDALDPLGILNPGAML